MARATKRAKVVCPVQSVCDHELLLQSLRAIRHAKFLSVRRLSEAPLSALACKKWVDFCSRPELYKKYDENGPEYLYKSSRICSDHFQPTDFNNPNLFSQGAGFGPTTSSARSMVMAMAMMIITTEAIPYSQAAASAGPDLMTGRAKSERDHVYEREIRCVLNDGWTFGPDETAGYCCTLPTPRIRSTFLRLFSLTCVRGCCG
ncbi:AGAP007257-PA-like protein [Anopheles sinensis]|uniref:AGAP007257-PA-like protein n=1 Tax=Anopheles sinensis TaxID=74873 RepID=A0A084VQV0_ANOSI|nr:AGAP007257-PA-like protein [Anopheles sinensis]